MRAFLLMFAVLAISLAVPGQNLVPNPSFESFSTCPNSFDQLNRCNNWVNPTATSPDYCHSCASSSICDVPNNAWGSQNGFGPSNAYVACVLYRDTSVFREYVQVKLTQPLTSGDTYRVSFRTSLADKSSWQIANISAHLGVTQTTSTGGGPLPVTPQINNPTTNIISDATGWTLITGTYVASGGEEWLTIGNFQDNPSTNAQSRSGTIVWGLYYFDDVTVEKISTGAGNRVIGWSDLPSPATTGFLDIQDVDNGCKPANTICRTSVPVRAAAEFAGGTGYDSRYRTAWISDGTVLSEVYVAKANTCRQRCKPIKATLADPEALVSGLAVADRRQQLFQLATKPGYMEIVTYDLRRCPVARDKCTMILPSGTVAGGLAYDEVNDVLYVSISTRTGNTFASTLFVMNATKPCTPLCKAPLTDCSSRLITGLAYDACERHLHVTNGQEVRTYEVTAPRNCAVKIGPCCKKQLAPFYRGLAIVPGWTKKSVGKSCTAAPCATCTSMVGTCVGDPALGTAFEMRLNNAPSGSFAALFVKGGPCGSGLPLFCGNFYPFPWLIFYPVSPVTGTTTCGGSASNRLPIPANPNLCGRTLCAQWWLFCVRQNQFGFGLSNAIEFTISGS